MLSFILFLQAGLIMFMVLVEYNDLPADDDKSRLVALYILL